MSKLLVRLLNFSSGYGIKRRQTEKPDTFTGLEVVHPMKVCM
ncbi:MULTISPECIES: hypothetical protein [Burkholderia]|nr:MULTISPECIES: hypothetical protein [Burkholderia]